MFTSNPEVAIEIFRYLSISDLFSVVNSNRRTQLIYESNKAYILSNLFERDFREISIKLERDTGFDLLFDDTREISESEIISAYEEEVNGIYTSVWQCLRNPQIPCKDVLKLNSILDLLRLLDRKLFRLVNERRVVVISRYCIYYYPTYLYFLVVSFPSFFYDSLKSRDGNIDTDLAYVVCSELRRLDKNQLKKALPVIYKLFVEPSVFNKKGMFSESYSSITRELLKDDIESWSGVVPLF